MSEITGTKSFLKKSLTLQYFEVLDVLMTQNEQNISNVSKKINGNNERIQHIIFQLEEIQMLEFKAGPMHSKLVVITDKGRAYWKTFHDMRNFLMEFGFEKNIELFW